MTETPPPAASTRYIRQTALPELGADGQARLAQSRVLVVGAGGLGSPALYYLAAAGVGRIGIAEFDVVAESNLQRQILYTAPDVGAAKLEVARARLAALNPEVQISAHPQGISTGNAIALASGYDVVLECTDSFASKDAVCYGATRARVPVVHAAIDGFLAQVAVFDPAGVGSACYRCLHPVAPRSVRGGGVIGPVAGIAGVVQAMQAIMLLSPNPAFRPLMGRLWEIDLRTMAAPRILDIPRDPRCPVCSGI